MPTSSRSDFMYPFETTSNTIEKHMTRPAINDINADNINVKFLLSSLPLVDINDFIKAVNLMLNIVNICYKYFLLTRFN